MESYQSSEPSAIGKNCLQDAGPDSPEHKRRGDGPAAPECDLQDPPGGSKTGSPWYIHEITQPPPSESLFFKYLEKWPLQRVAKDVLGWSRFQKCYRVPVASTVDLVRNQESGRAFYKNLSICGSVWVCPVCASKITERRRVELEGAIEAARVLGLDAYLLTLTVPHTSNDVLGELLGKFKDARRLMRNRKPWQAWAFRVGLVGSIRALEVTQGEENGWHVHTHEILFCRSSKQKNGCAGSSVLSSTDQVQFLVPPVSADVLPFWKSACLTVGLNEPNQHGVDLRSGDDAIGDYVSKWGIASETTKSMIKRGRNGRRSPWDLLREYFMTGDESAADRFREYAENFKGKRQLVWSDGLREMFGMAAEKTDEEIALEPEKGNDILESISLADWRSIMKYHHDVRGQLLIVALYGSGAVREFIDKIQRGDKTA